MKGGLVVYPTETVYGLGANPYDIKAVKKTFKAKGREKKPLPLLVSSLKKARTLAHFPNQALNVAKDLWPGPLTIILKRRETSPSWLGGNPNLIGLRIPNHPAALRLTRLCGGCLTGTSANISGKTPPTTAEEAERQIGDKVDLILDGGRTGLGVSSTVLDLSTGNPRILRMGPADSHKVFRLTGVAVRETSAS